MTSTRHRHGPNKTIGGIGRVVLWGGGSLWIGRDAGRGQAHAHHAIQISLALSGRVRLRSHDEGEWSEYLGALVSPHCRHQYDGCGESVAQIFVEPETLQGRALLERYKEMPICSLATEFIEPLIVLLRIALETAPADDALIATGQQSLAMLSGEEPAPPSLDPRISRAIKWVRARMATPVALGEAARIAHLSPSRFRHLFMAQTGASFRAYLLWARVESAVGAGMGGASWTEAAQNSGFADSAHFSRTCRRMFGIAPTMLIREQPKGRDREKRQQ